MKKSWAFLFLWVILSAGGTSSLNAVVVVVDQPGVVFTNRQPLQAIVVDSNGNNFQQTVYYDPSLGGIDLDTSWTGPNASVYFPTLNTGYVWYNGYWVNPAGYYWNGGRRYYVGPHWNNYWAGYWRGRDHWNGGWHENEWHGDWHGSGWHGGENWHGGGWHGGHEGRGGGHHR